MIDVPEKQETLRQQTEELPSELYKFKLYRIKYR